MLNDEQHEKVKRLVKKAMHGDNYHERHHALEDLAQAIDPEHWNNGLYFKDRKPGRTSDAEHAQIIADASRNWRHTTYQQ